MEDILATGSSSSGESYSQESMDDIGYQSIVPNCLKKIHKVSNSSPRKISLSNSAPENNHSFTMESSSIYDANMSFDPFSGTICPASAPNMSTKISPFGKRLFDKSVRFSSPLIEGYNDSPTKNSSWVAESSPTNNKGNAVNDESSSATLKRSTSSDSHFSLTKNSTNFLRGLPKPTISSPDMFEGPYEHESDDFAHLKELNLVRKQQKQARPPAFERSKKGKNVLSFDNGKIIAKSNTKVLNDCDIFDIVEVIISSMRESDETPDENLSEGISVIERLSEKAKTKIGSLYKSNLELTRNIGALQNKAKEETENETAARTSLKETNYRLESLTAKNQKIENELKDMSIKIKNLEAEIQTKQTKLDQKSAEKETLETTLTHSCTTIGKITKNEVEPSTLNEEVNSIVSKLEDLSNEKTKLDHELKEIRAENSKLKLEKSEDLKSINVFSTKCNKQEEVLEKLHIQIENLEKEKVDRDIAIKQQKGNFEKNKQQLEKEMWESSKQILTLQNSSEDFTKQFSEQSKILDTYKGQMNSQTQILHKRESELKQHKEAIEKLTKIVEETNSQFEHMNRYKLKTDEQIVTLIAESKKYKQVKERFIAVRSKEQNLKKELQETHNTQKNHEKAFKAKFENFEDEILNLKNAIDNLENEKIAISEAFSYIKYYFENLVNHIIVTLSQYFEEESLAYVDMKMKQIAPVTIYSHSDVLALERINEFLAESMTKVIASLHQTQVKKNEAYNQISHLKREVLTLKKRASEHNVNYNHKPKREKEVVKGQIKKPEIDRAKVFRAKN